MSSPHIQKLLEGLDEETRTILKMRYGLMADGVRRTLTEIATATGRSREELRRIEAEATARIRRG